MKNIFLNIINPKYKSGFKNSFYLSLGTMISRMINIIGFIYIPVKLGAEEYGKYAIVLSYIGLFNIVTFPGLDKVCLREGSKDFNKLGVLIQDNFRLKIYLSLTGIILAIIIAILIPQYNYEIIILILLYSPQIIYFSIHGLFNTIFQAKEQMKYISYYNITNRLVFVISAVIFLYFGMGIIILLLLNLFSNFLTIFLTYRKSISFISYKITQQFKIHKDLLKQAVIFSLILFGVLISSKIDIFMMSLMTDTKSVGQYSVAEKIVGQFEMMRNMVAIAFFPIFVKKFDSTKGINAKNFLGKVIIILVTMLIITYVLSTILPYAIDYIYGVEYLNSGKILSVLLFYLVFLYAAVPLTNAMQAAYLEKFVLNYIPVTIVLKISLNYIFFYKYGIIGFAYSALIVHITIFSFYFIFGSIKLKKKGYFI